MVTLDVHAVQVCLDLRDAAASTQGGKRGDKIGRQGRIAHSEAQPHHVRSPEATMVTDYRLDSIEFKAVEALQHNVYQECQQPHAHANQNCTTIMSLAHVRLII